MSKDILDIIRNSKFDRNALNRQADQTGSGRTAVEKDFVISATLFIHLGASRILKIFSQDGLQRRHKHQEDLLSR